MASPHIENSANSSRKRSRREGPASLRADGFDDEQDENCAGHNTNQPQFMKAKEGAVSVKNQQSFDFSQYSCFSQDLVCALLSFLTTLDDVIAICSVCKSWNTSMNDENILKRTPVIKANGDLNFAAFQLLKKHNEGTEGVCYKVRQRATGSTLAMRKPRVLPNQEGFRITFCVSFQC